MNNSAIVEDTSKLKVMTAAEVKSAPQSILTALKNDQVILVQGVSAVEADRLMYWIAESFGLQDSLELQSAFASSMGHRQNIGEYYMSVNRRDDYQFVSPHSEGSSFTQMQLASFYCYENTTDGAETILLHVKQDTPIWDTLKEKLRRGKSARPLSPAEIQQVRGMLRLNMPEDSLRDDDVILSENQVAPGFTAYEVLAKLKPCHSAILDKPLYVYFDSVESIDNDSAAEFKAMLEALGLLKQPEGAPLSVEQLDSDKDNRVKPLGSRYEQLFDYRLCHKLQQGEFVILNNFTWTHAVNNWTPGSGERKVVGAFA